MTRPKRGHFPLTPIRHPSAPWIITHYAEMPASVTKRTQKRAAIR